MSNFFSSLSKVIHTSLLLSILLFIFLSFGVGGFDIDTYFWSWLFRYFHVAAGIMWIGLLWYFNFVQVPNMSKITDEQKPAITKVIAPSALFWFRWAALVTVITGLIVAYLNGYVHDAMVLGIVEATPEEKPIAAKRALIASRTNTLLSLPMLLSMVAAQNLY